MKGENAMSIQSQIHKFGATILQNLPDVPEDKMQDWIEDPRRLQEFLSGLCRPTEFKVFKTIKLGTGPKNADDFRKSLKDNGFRISNRADDILGKPAFSVAEEKTEVDLVVASVAELGFNQGATREQIYTRAQGRGLQLSPNEVGPQLRSQHKGQPNGERLIIGMEPITGSAGYLGLFSVEHDGDGLWLDSYYVYPGTVWYGSTRFVFVLPRK